jgi:hypothetical protein
VLKNREYKSHSMGLEDSFGILESRRQTHSDSISGQSQCILIKTPRTEVHHLTSSKIEKHLTSEGLCNPMLIFSFYVFGNTVLHNIYSRFQATSFDLYSSHHKTYFSSKSILHNSYEIRLCVSTAVCQRVTGNGIQRTFDHPV